MKLPSWFPQVRRPWNPAYRGVWHVMTKEERQWSLAVDLLVGFVAISVFLLAGCNRAPEHGTVVRANPDENVPIYTDTRTGCQYIGYLGHGVTPRLDENGKPICGRHQPR